MRKCYQSILNYEQKQNGYNENISHFNEGIMAWESLSSKVSRCDEKISILFFLFKACVLVIFTLLDTLRAGTLCQGQEYS